MQRYEVRAIGTKCKFYELNDSNGKRLATIEFCGRKVFKYTVVFAYTAVKNNLVKTKGFLTLKEAKNYVKEVLGE